MATIESVAADIRRNLQGHFNDLEYLAQLFVILTSALRGCAGEGQEHDASTGHRSILPYLPVILVPHGRGRHEAASPLPA
jgi:hypothetical protein